MEATHTSQPREQHKRKQLDISVDLGEEDDLEMVVTPGQLKGLIKVPAGPINPFFAPGESILSRASFTEWQARYQKSIQTAGLWPAVQEKLKQIT